MMDVETSRIRPYGAKSELADVQENGITAFGRLGVILDQKIEEIERAFQAILAEEAVRLLKLWGLLRAALAKFAS